MIIDSRQIPELTARQQEVLETIIENIETNGFPPTVRELRDHLGVNSIRGASIHLDALEKKGYIQRTGQARGIRVLHDGIAGQTRHEIRIPLLGFIQAGKPLLAEENIEKYINVKRSYIKGNVNAFGLRVRGESMINAGIKPGDIALVTPADSADNGDIVVALLEDSATLKKYYQVDNYVALLPANPAFEPIIGKDFRIQGKLVGIVRSHDEPSGSLYQDACLVPVYKDEALDQPNSMVQWIYGRTID